jgi:hypothetical protein
MRAGNYSPEDRSVNDFNKTNFFILSRVFGTQAIYENVFSVS